MKQLQKEYSEKNNKNFQKSQKHLVEETIFLSPKMGKMVNCASARPFQPMQPMPGPPPVAPPFGDPMVQDIPFSDSNFFDEICRIFMDFS